VALAAPAVAVVATVCVMLVVAVSPLNEAFTEICRPPVVKGVDPVNAA
jgi:hypothetical protein